MKMVKFVRLAVGCHGEWWGIGGCDTAVALLLLLITELGFGGAAKREISHTLRK
jgi:hypothetical protein